MCQADLVVDETAGPVERLRVIGLDPLINDCTGKTMTTSANGTTKTTKLKQQRKSYTSE